MSKKQTEASDALMKKMRRKSRSKSTETTNTTNDTSIDVITQPRPMRALLHEMRQSNDPALVYSSARSQLHHLQDTAGVKEHPLQRYLELREPVSLFSYQHTGVQFMEARERDADAQGTRSGLLCDEMGLGKSRQMLSVILRSQQRRAEAAQKRFSGEPTLLLCPKIVLDVWLAEVAKFPRECFVVQDLRRLDASATPEQDAYYYSECDLVLCSYPMLRAVYNHHNNTEDEENRDNDVVDAHIQDRRYKLLFGRTWQRVCADEAQHIVVKETQLVGAIEALRYDVMWHITGTPLKNTLHDLRTLLWLCGVKRELSEEDITQLLGRLMLRRTKYDLIQSMATPSPPQLTELTREPITTTQYIEFETACERMLYCTYAAYARKRRAAHQGNTLVLIHYLRQLCLAAALVKGLLLPPGMCTWPALEPSPSCETALRSHMAARPSIEDGPVQYEYRPGKSYGDERPIAVCWQPLGDVVTEEERASYDVMLDEWRRHGTVTQRMTEVPLEETRWQAVMQNLIEHTLFLDHPSSKERALLHWVDQLPPCDKGVIFAMSVSLLNRLHGFLDERGVRHCIIHSKLGDQHNTRETRRFQSEPDVRVLLLSLKMGNAGLNLQCANHGAFADGHWNPVEEVQGLARIQRTGQTKQVYITHMSMRATVEAYVTRMQHDKQALIDRHLPENGGKGASPLSEKQEAELFDFTVAELRQM